MRKLTLVVAVACVLPSLVDARAAVPRDVHGHPQSLGMTCAQAQAYIANNDGAILATGNVYASFHSSFCNDGADPGSSPGFVRTSAVSERTESTGGFPNRLSSDSWFPPREGGGGDGAFR